ncbi:MAG: hypothetical protein GC192_14410 [Bacteroidetes bacterium]|nr:hypothetical protein [Bacteroidota bacterium]
MKQFSTFLFFVIFIACNAVAQNEASTNWQVARFGIATGGDLDMPVNLNHHYLLKTANDLGFEDSNLPFTSGEMTRMNCDNGTFRIGLSITPLRSPNTELQFSFLDISGRIDMVHYELGSEGSADYQWLEVNAENKETALEAVFLKRHQTGKRWSWYGGLGTNFGFSHSGKVHVKGLLLDDSISDNPASGQEFDLTYNQRESFNQRLFLQGGVGFRFLKRMEFGFELRKGIGYRASFGGPTRMTILKRSLGFSLRCQLS